MESVLKPALILRKLQRRYFFLFFFSLLLSAVGALVVNHLGDAYQFSPTVSQTASYLSIGLVLLLLPVAHALPQRRINLLSREIPLSQLIALYSRSVLLRLSLIKVAVVIALLGFVIAKNTDMLLLVAISLLFFTLNRPSRFKVAKDLNLSSENEALLSEL